MKPYIILVVPFLVPKKYAGITIFPFIFFKHKKYLEDKVLVNHEKIHIWQQLELLVIPFYLLYVFFYLYNFLKYRNHDDAYFEIPFEREAYSNEFDLEYLKKRPFWNWRKYF
jgi:hypothetical protein